MTLLSGSTIPIPHCVRNDNTIAGDPFTFGMPSVALATYDKLPHLAGDEQALVDALAALDVRAQPAVWTDHSVAWDAFDAVVIRSC